VEECGPCFFFASFTLAFALQLREKHGKPPVRVRKPSVRLGQTCQSTVYILPKHPHITKLTQTHTFQNPHIHTHTYTLQNNIKTSQYKLKQTQYKIYPNEIVTI
jgi:hypothetical protein